MERQRVNEIFLGLIFIVLLIIMILSFVSVSASNVNGKTSNDYSSNKNSEIINSYNSYNYFSGDSWYQYENELNGVKNYRINSYKDDRYSYSKYKKDRFDYSSQGRHERYYGLFDNEVNKYKVKVKNKGHEGDYYKVTFYLTDYSGKTRSETVIHYIKPHESKDFVYRNVFNDGKEYKYWSYKIN